MKMSRRERRELARQNGTKFIPRYNGKGPRSYKEHFGVGYERFNNKFVTIAEVK